jgi:uncharacterized protein DUF6174
VSLLRTVILTAVIATAACDSDIVGPGDFRLLAQARAKWDARPFTDYSYEIRTFCFCPPEVNRWTRVTVRGGAVTDAQPVETDPQFPITSLSLWQPIDSLFVGLHNQMTTPTAQSPYEAITVQYDERLGYPTSIVYRGKPTVADAGAEITVRNVVPLN